MDADFMDIDSDLAFRLQLQDALAASLALSQRNDAVHAAAARPSPKQFGEASSSAASSDSVFRLYFKGLVNEANVGGENLVVAGIGVAICDQRNGLVFQVRKPLTGNGNSRNSAKLKALIEGLAAALSLELKRITIFCDSYPIFQFINGRWLSKQQKLSFLVDQVKSLQSQFVQCDSRLVSRCEIKFAPQLARHAIESQSQTNPTEPSTGKIAKETCVICMEDRDANQMFAVDGCLHRYCFSCMRQHMEAKLLDGMTPRCPHEVCDSELGVESCMRFLPPKHVDIMRQRIKEASIPTSERVYCPYPRCSVLMSKTELLEHSKATLRGALEKSGLRRCMKCHYRFCIHCKVPWHRKSTCEQYEKNLNPREEDTKLKSLASKNLWRQCVKCNHMIELLTGCHHMTCRCNYEFCYLCGAEWKNKQATCKCPLWIDENIIDEDEVENEDEVEGEDEG